MSMLCYVRHDWLGWSEPVVIGLKLMQARSCRRCNKTITRCVVDSREFFAKLHAQVRKEES
jgi:hypothetical protein